MYQECYEQTQKYYKKIQQNGYHYVIIGQIWDEYLTDHIINDAGDERSDSLSKRSVQERIGYALNVISQSGAKPVLIKSTALTKYHARDCFFKHFKLHRSYQPDECNVALQTSENERWIYSLFDEMKLKYPQVILIDPKQVQCSTESCTILYLMASLYLAIRYILPITRPTN